MSFWKRNIAEWGRLPGVLAELGQAVEHTGTVLADTLKAGRTVLACGNGGSAAQASHLCTELVGRYDGDRPALNAVSLTADGSLLTCVLNDYGHDELFARQVRGLGKTGDVLVGLSTSARSQNVANALSAAREQGMTTIALLGRSGEPSGKRCCGGLADHEIVVPHDVTARIQEVHLLIIHTWCEMIELRIANGE